MVLLCLFPLAPYKLKIGVVYASLGLVRHQEHPTCFILAHPVVSACQGVTLCHPENRA